MRPKVNTTAPAENVISTLKLADFNAIKVEFPTKAATSFEKINGAWRMTSPYKMRADQISVQRILSIIAATSAEKYTAKDMEKYGLTNPELRLKLSGTQNAEFVFGTHNPITEEQYMAYKDAVYLVKTTYAEAATVQPIELIDKYPLSQAEANQISGINFAKLEQWEALGLQVDMVDGQWRANVAKAKPTQNDLNEWFEFSWRQSPAKSVELYTPDRKQSLPSIEIKLKDGKTVLFDKIQESPELLLGRPDEGILYHLNNDVGFTMLNPPLNIAQ